MATKQEVIELLKEGLLTEEDAIPLYCQHINSTLFLSGFKNDEKEKVVKILDILRKDSERHKLAYEELLAKVEEADKNVY